MKKNLTKILFLLVFITGISTRTYSLTNNWTIAGSTSDGWEAYLGTGMPAGWPSPSGVNWGNPIAGWPNPTPNEFDLIKALFPSGSVPNNPKNFVWAKNAFIAPATTFYRKKFDRTVNDCNRVRILACSDEDRKIFVNGILVQSLGLSVSPPSIPWQVLSNIDITNLLKCGTNEITIEVTNTSSYCCLVANLQITDQPIKYTGVASYNTNVRCSEILKLKAPVLDGATYTWDGPNGFHSNLQNPEIANATTKHKGVYTCTLQLACCKLYSSVTVDFENCDVCSAEIDTTQLSCQVYKVNVQSRFVNIKCFQWQLDGVNVSGSINEHITNNLSPGHHDICYLYWGNRKSDENIFCCERVCIRIYIPTIDTLSLDTAYCYIPGKNGKYIIYNPCSKFPQYKYTTELPGKYAESKKKNCNPNTYHILTKGLWIYRFYDSKGCLRKVLFVNVNEHIAKSFVCEDFIQEGCDTTVDPQTVMPRNVDGCDSCYKTSLNDPNAHADLISMWSNGNKTYQKTFYDEINCTYCVFTFTIAPFKCPDFDLNIIVTTTSNPHVYRFAMLEDESEFCSQELFEFTNTLTGAVISPVVQRNPILRKNIFTVTFPSGPGTYRICLTMAKCYCDNRVRCTKTKCITLVIDGPSPYRERFMDENSQEILPSNLDLLSELSTINNVQDKPKSTELKLIPNPTSSKFQIVPSNVNSESITIYDNVQIISASGLILNEFNSLKSSEIIKTDKLDSGIYNIRVSWNNQIENLKLIVTH
jgi:hypothetical protein